MLRIERWHVNRYW